MIHFTQKVELVLWLDRHAPSEHIRRAIWDMPTELLGGFSKIPPSECSGWIIKLKSKHNKVYLMAVLYDMVKMCYRVMEIDEVPWHLWDGKLNRRTIYDGDHPEKYMELKNERI